MPEFIHPPIEPRCKLCAAFAASGLPTAAERGLPGNEIFSRDPDICDACLSQDFSTGVPRLSFEQRFGLVFGCFVAFIAATLITLQHREIVANYLTIIPPFPRAMVILILVALVLAVPCILFTWLVIRSFFRWGTRRSANGTKDEAIDAERFSWLAVWASLTGHPRYERRILKQLARLGVKEVPRLSNSQSRN